MEEKKKKLEKIMTNLKEQGFGVHGTITPETIVLSLSNVKSSDFANGLLPKTKMTFVSNYGDGRFLSEFDRKTGDLDLYFRPNSLNSNNYH